MKRRWIIFNIVSMVLAILTPIVSILMVFFTAEIDVYQLAGLNRNMWLLWLFIPIELAIIAIGIVLKIRKKGFIGGIIAGTIGLGFLVVFGSFTITFNSRGFFSYDNEYLQKAVIVVDADFLDGRKSATEINDDGFTTYAKISDDEIDLLQDNSLWLSAIDSKIQNALPDLWDITSSGSEYFFFYNKTLNEYNVYPSESGTYECAFACVDKDLHRFVYMEFVLVDG